MCAISIIGYRNPLCSAERKECSQSPERLLTLTVQCALRLRNIQQEIINNICSHLGIAKADLAKRMGLHPSSLYRKLSKESMTFEELQKCLDILGVSLELEFHYPDGDILNSQTNHEQLIDRMDILEKELEAARKVDEFRKKSLREIRTELNSAVGYAELCRSHGSQMDLYLDKLSIVHGNMEKTISFALGESINDETVEVDVDQINALQGKRILLVDDN